MSQLQSSDNKESKNTKKNKNVKRANSKNIMELLQNHFFEFVKKVVSSDRLSSNLDKTKLEETSSDVWVDFKVNVNKDIKNFQKSVVRPYKQPKDKNAPTKRRSAYIFYCMDKRADVIKQYPEYKVTQISIELGARWQKLTDDEKKPYQEKSQVDKERYDNEMENYKKPESANVKSKKKRGSSAYNVFCAERRPRLKKNNEDKSSKEIVKMLSQMWKETTDEMKKKYKKLAEAKRKNMDNESDADDEGDGEKKKVVTGYNLFSNEVKADLKKENPKMKNKEITNLLVKKWGNLSESKKGEYNLQASKLKKDE
jgi:hypothetical protein